MKKFLKNILSTMIGVLFGSILAFILVPMLLVAIFKGAQSGQREPIDKNSILHIRMSGLVVEKHRALDFDIFGNGSIFQEDRTIGLYELIKAIRAAKDDSRIKGIYLELRDFEAGWASVAALRRELEEFKSYGKWVYSYGERLDEMGAYLSSVSTRSHMQPHGDLELNGLAVNEAFLKGLFNKLEIEPRIFRVGKFKAAIEPLTLEKMSDENRAQTQVLVDDIWQKFRGDVSKGVTIEEAALDAAAKDLTVVSAEDAKKAGLIHELIFEDQLEDNLTVLATGDKKNDLSLVLPGRLLKDARKRVATGKKKVAIVFADGEIVSGQGSGRSQVGSETFREDILEAKEDEEVAAIVVRVNSPGGDALASDVMWRELRKTDDSMPVVISMGDVAASGGYYIAAAGRYIFAEPTTVTGSIGVFGVMFDAQKFFNKKAGVTFDRVVTHPYADIGNFARPMSPFESQVIQKEVERVYKRFLDVVEEGRGYEKRADLENIAEGRVWSGVRAKDLGLIDELGGLDAAIKKAAEFAELKDYEVEVFPHATDPFQQILEKLSGDTLAFVAKATGSEALARFVRVPMKAIETKPGVYMRLPFDFQIR